MKGFLPVSRDHFSDPDFKQEQFTEREAFLWLCMEAAFKPQEKRFGSSVILLNRGQAVVSLRFAANAWQWLESRVRRFLKRLEKRRRITCVVDAGITVVTICNYNEFGDGWRVTDALGGATPTHQQRTTDANEKKEKREKEKVAAVGCNPDPEELDSNGWTPDRLHDEVLSACGLKHGRLPTYWQPPSATVHVWRWVSDLGLTPSDIIEAARATRARHAEPPQGPKALDNAMRRLAGQQQAAPLKPAVATPSAATPRPTESVIKFDLAKLQE